MSAHLDRLAAQVYDIEQTVGAAVTTGLNSGDTHIRDLQSLDFLRQSLEDLALLNLFLAQVDEGPPVSPSFLASRLKMEITRLIVVGGTNGATGDPFEDTGDLDLF